MKTPIKKYALFAAAILIVAICLGKFCSSSSSAGGQNTKPSVQLNSVLTNEMSQIEALMGMEKDFEAYFKKWDIRGASLSIMRNDSLIYSKGFGWADKEEGVEMTPGKILRVASVSKLITATGIMILQERGKLSLQDKVFGDEGILCNPEFTQAIGDKRMLKITVEQLLRHKGGFSTGLGDPMFTMQDIMRQNGLTEVPSTEEFVKIILRRRLGFEPGTSQSYSNFGYLLLSMIIERVSGESYETFMQKNVLRPAGCFDMHIAGNYYEDHRANEVKYYMQKDAELREDFHLNGEMVEKCYGGSDIAGLSGAGAWCASSAELCRFVASIDGRDEIRDIISKESVAAMTEYFDEQTYSLGWNDTKPDGEWTRTGTLSGTTALIKCYPDGECWIMITNTGTYRGPSFAKHSSTMFRRSREAYSHALPARNLFTPSF